LKNRSCPNGMQYAVFLELRRDERVKIFARLVLGAQADRIQLVLRQAIVGSQADALESKPLSPESKCTRQLCWTQPLQWRRTAVRLFSQPRLTSCKQRSDHL